MKLKMLSIFLSQYIYSTAAKILFMIIEYHSYGTVTEKQLVPPLIEMDCAQLGIGGHQTMLFMLHPRCVLLSLLLKISLWLTKCYPVVWARAQLSLILILRFIYGL